MSIQTIKCDNLEYLVAEGISVPHCFTTRYGGVSTGSQASMNLAIGRGDSPENVEENLRILGRALDFEPEKLVLTRQIHSDIVRVVKQWGTEMPSATRYSSVPCFCVMIIIILPKKACHSEPVRTLAWESPMVLYLPEDPGDCHTSLRAGSQ